MEEKTITITEIKSCTTWSKKDNSPRGCKTVSNTEIKPGDYVVYNNRFTEVIDDPAEEIEEQENTTEEENTMNVYGEYFYGNRISEYGLENGYVDYGTLAKSFDAVMCDFEKLIAAAGYDFEDYNGYGTYYEDTNGDTYDYSEAQDLIEELQEAIDELDEDENADEIAELENRIEALEDEHYTEVFQYFIVSNNGAEILSEAGEPVYYSNTLDMYVWGVNHWGTSWDYVLTNIKCNTGKI